MKKADNRRKLAQFPKNSIYVSPLAHRKTPIQQLSGSAKQQIAKLVELTNQGAHDGPAELYSTVVLATVWLTWLCKKKPELFMGIARNKFYWPLMCNLHPGDIRKNAQLLEKLTLGADTQINLSGKSFSWDVPANRAALDLHKLARMLQRTPMKSWTLHDLTALRGVGFSFSGCYMTVALCPLLCTPR